MNNSIVVRFSLAVSCAVLVLSNASQPGGTTPKSPLIPTEEQKTFHLDAGLRIELVAGEPEIESPVAMAFDEDGRLWVVEMRDYPNGPAKGQPPEGRIKILEDKDGDGRYETSRVFADHLLFANGLMPWKGGVFVTAAPHILYLKDTDGDGKADQKDVLFEGFAEANPQLRVSYPMLGLDGWVYCCNGLRGGQIRRAGSVSDRRDSPQAPVAKAPGSPLNLSGKDFRFNPNNPDQFEAISGMGQFGHTFDDWGNRFVCDNNHHLRHVVLEDRYIKRNPFLAVPTVVEDTSELEAGPLSSGGKIYPLTRNWTTSSLHAGRFTAACGVHIYRGSLLGDPYRGAAFTCDPTGNLVHMEILRPHGATFRSKPHKQGVEFLASTDEWFRPVFLTGGPDGALYVVDMYRAVIEHPEFVPEELKRRPDLLLGKNKGRIWRIVPANHSGAQKTLPGTTTKDLNDLCKLVDDANDWQRMKGHRLLLESDPFMFTPPPKQAEFWATQFRRGSELTRLHIAFISPVFFYSINEGLRFEVMAIRRLEERALHNDNRRAPAFSRILKSINSDDSSLRFQCALSLGFWADPESVPALAQIALRDTDDRWTRWAVESSVNNRAGALIAELFKQGLAEKVTPARLTLLQELAALVGARQDADEVAGLLDTLRLHNDKLPTHGQMAAFLGLADGMGRRGKQLFIFVETLPGERKQEKMQAEFLFALAEAVAREKTKPEEQAMRADAVRLLAHASWPAAERTLPPLLADDNPQDLRLAAVRSLAAHPRPEVATLLMKSWKTYAPPLRREVLEAMFRQPDRIEFLLKEIEAGRVKPGDLDAQRTRQLVNHSNPEIRDKAKKLLQDNLPAERKEVLARYQASLKLKSDPKLGRDVFQKHCATCHRVGGIGVDVGADIADTRTKTPEQLLNDILNPNAAIDANYINYIVQTKAGRVATGVIAAETASSVTLKRAENQVESILRQDIEEMQSTGLSLMPEGLEKEISVEQMAHLIDFLKNWRYMDGLTPLSPPGGEGSGVRGVSSPLSPLRGEGPGERGSTAQPPHPNRLPRSEGEGLTVFEHDDYLLIETDCLSARINKKGYVSGTAAGSLVDKKTGAKDLGFGLHIMDFLLAPGWRDDGYTRDAKLHGNLPKHYVEGPQICTQAKELKPEIIRHKEFVAVRLKYTFHKPGAGYKAGSTWTQTLVFKPGERFFFGDERITTVNDVDGLFYRIDMPGHIKHRVGDLGDSFEKVYLSYHGEIPASEFKDDFAPDARFLHQRQATRIPERMIRAYQVKQDGKPGPWLAGMTLDPGEVSEAWCHQRGYVCMIQENHRARVKAGETFGAAYIVGWFDSIKDMHAVYDQFKGTKEIVVEADRVKLRK